MHLFWLAGGLHVSSCYKSPSECWSLCFLKQRLVEVLLQVSHVQKLGLDSSGLFSCKEKKNNLNLHEHIGGMLTHVTESFSFMHGSVQEPKIDIWLWISLFLGPFILCCFYSHYAGGLFQVVGEDSCLLPPNYFLQYSQFPNCSKKKSIIFVNGSRWEIIGTCRTTSI